MDKIALPPGLPVGFRFHPTDEELITYYLKPKLLGTNPAVDTVIAEVDFYKFEPWELPDESKIKSEDRMWLFFCRRDYKYTNSKRVKRTTKTGFWKITGKERVIKDKDTKACIGKKRTLVFHLRSAASGRCEKTDWVMHEYFVESDHTFHDQSPHVLCRLKIKGNDMANTPDGNAGDNITGVESPVALDLNPSAHGMIQTTIPALDAEVFDDPFALSNGEVLEMLRSQPLYSPLCMPRSPVLFHNLRQVGKYNGVGGQSKWVLNSSAISFEDDVELTANLIPKKKEFFPRMITSLKRCFDFLFYSRSSSEKNSTVGQNFIH